MSTRGSSSNPVQGRARGGGAGGGAAASADPVERARVRYESAKARVDELRRLGVAGAYQHADAGLHKAFPVLARAKSAYERARAKAANGGVAPAKAVSHTARQTAAVSRAAAAIPEAAGEPQRLRTALLEAAAERLASDAAFARSVRERYAVGGETAAKPKKGDFGPMPPLIRTAGLNRQSPLRVLDPYELALDYGRNQLRNVVRRASLPNLRVAVGLVKERNPGKKPSGTSKQDLTDFIVEYVAGPDY